MKGLLAYHKVRWGLKGQSLGLGENWAEVPSAFPFTSGISGVVRDLMDPKGAGPGD